MFLNEDNMEWILIEIDYLCWYIRKGCLFDLNLGEGIEFNESFYYVLNRLLLCGVIIIGLELVIVVIIFLF